MAEKDRVAGHRAEYKKKLDRISIKNFDKKYDKVSKSQQKIIENEFKDRFSDYPVQPENVDDYDTLSEIINKIPTKKGGVNKPTVLREKKKQEAIYILSKLNKPKKCKPIPFNFEKEIEDLLEDNPEILEKDLIIIGRQVQTENRKIIDLLGLDKNGNTVIIELKKGETPHYTSAQILDYYSWVKRLKRQQQINEIAKKKYRDRDHLGSFRSIEQKFIDNFGNPPDDWNKEQKLIIVGEQIDETTMEVATDMMELGMNIFCIELNAYDNGDEKIVNVRKIPFKR